MEKETLERLLAEGVSVEGIGRRFDKHPSTVAYWMKKYGLEAVGNDKHGRRTTVDDARFRELVERGLSIRQIAAEMSIADVTVRRHLAKRGLKTARTRATGAHLVAKEAGARSIELRCAHHGDSEFVIEGRGYYRCKRCRAERVSERRRQVKALLVAEAGGRCVICGYDRHIGSLQFHHLDPHQKRLSVSRDGVTLSLTAARAEAAKCVLLCANCHAEVEGGVATVPDRVLSVEDPSD
jgi:transposase-like protein